MDANTEAVPQSFDRQKETKETKGNNSPQPIFFVAFACFCSKFLVLKSKAAMSRRTPRLAACGGKGKVEWCVCC
jgi:hypothetical protein